MKTEKRCYRIGDEFVLKGFLGDEEATKYLSGDE